MNGYAGLSTPWAGYLKHKMDKLCRYLSTNICQHMPSMSNLSSLHSTNKNAPIPRNSSFHKTFVYLIDTTDKACYLVEF